jgi:hypothetical protein
VPFHMLAAIQQAFHDGLHGRLHGIWQSHHDALHDTARRV